MRPELEQLRLVEEQLLGRPAAAAAWRVRLLLEPALQAEVQLQQQLYDGLRAAGRQQLRQELATIHARLYPPRRRAWLQTAAARLRRAWPWPTRLGNQ